MKSSLILSGLALVAFGAVAAIKGVSLKKTKPQSPIQPKRILSENEQPMYFRLTQSLPDCVILSQVAFSAMVTARLQNTRNKFNRKFADFVVCNKAFDIIAIVELDDPSHKGREREDTERDAILKQAGYRILRYKRVPDIEKIKADFPPLPGGFPAETKHISLVKS